MKYQRKAWASSVSSIVNWIRPLSAGAVALRRLSAIHTVLLRPTCNLQQSHVKSLSDVFTRDILMIGKLVSDVFKLMMMNGQDRTGVFFIIQFSLFQFNHLVLAIKLAIVIIICNRSANYWFMLNVSGRVQKEALEEKTGSKAGKRGQERSEFPVFSCI